jgi:hypothetical protein
LLTRRFLEFTAAVLCSSVACFPFQHKESSPPDPPEEEEGPKVYEAEAPNPIGGFPEAERLLATLLPEWANNKGTPPPTVLRRYLVGKDWGMQRANNGVITGRATGVVLFYKGGVTGKCYNSLCNVTQEEQGGKWGKPWIQCVEGRTILVTCPSIDRLPASP